MKLSERLKLGASTPSTSFASLRNSITKVEQQVQRIDKRWPDTHHASIVEIDPQALCIEMMDRLERWDWKGVTLSKACKTVRAIWSANLWDDSKFEELRAFFSKVSHSEAAGSAQIDPRPNLAKVFFDLYFDTFQSESRRTALLSKILEKTYKFLKQDITDLVENYDLLDPDQVASSLSYLMVDFDHPFDDLRKMGIHAPHAKGLMQACHLEFLKRLEKPLLDGDRATIETLFRWLQPGKNIPPYELVGAMTAIKALLLPWEHRDPPQEIRKLIIDKLISIYGDPRINRSGPWMVMDDTVESILMKWLTEANLIAFLDIVGRVIKKEEPQNAHMWPARRKFWETMWKNGHIEAAWVALSDAGRDEAERIALEADSQEILGCARVNGDKHKCFLFLKCGNKIIAEGSHNFKVHVFDKKQRTCPKLFKSSYTIDLIRNGHAKYGSFTHDVHRGWERKVLKALS